MVPQDVAADRLGSERQKIEVDQPQVGHGLSLQFFNNNGISIVASDSRKYITVNIPACYMH